MTRPTRLIVAITGATGDLWRAALQHLRALEQVETHLMISDAGVLNAIKS